MQQTHYDRILDILCSTLEAYSAVLFLPHHASPASKENEDGQAYYIASAFSLGNQLNYDADIYEGRGLIGWILRNREPLLVSNFDRRQNHLGYYTGNEEHSIKAFMGCALPGGGALCVDSKRQYSFSEKNQKILYLFADLIDKLLADDSRREEERLQLKYYDALSVIYALRHQYSRWGEFLRRFLNLMATTTSFDYCILCTRDSNGKSYSVEGENTPLMLKPGKPPPSFPMTHGIVGWIFRNGSPVRSGGANGSPDAMLLGKDAGIPHFQTVFALPLDIQRKTHGVLCLAHDVPLPISATTQVFARMAAEHLSLFLENLYVKCRLRDLRQEIQAEQER